MDERLVALERQVRRQRAAVTVLTGALLTVALMGQAGPPTDLRARSLTMVDEQGQTYAQLCLRDGGPDLRMWSGPNRTTTVMLSSTATETMFALHSPTHYLEHLVTLGQFVHANIGGTKGLSLQYVCVPATKIQGLAFHDSADQIHVLASTP